MLREVPSSTARAGAGAAIRAAGALLLGGELHSAGAPRRLGGGADEPTNRPNSELQQGAVHHLPQPVVTSHEDGD